MDADSGDLWIAAGGQDIRFRKPVIYQPATQTAARQEAEGRFPATGNRATFGRSEFDPTRQLGIDPVLAGKVGCSANSLVNDASLTISMTARAVAQSGAALTDTAAVSSLVYDATPVNHSCVPTTTVN